MKTLTLLFLGLLTSTLSYASDSKIEVTANMFAGSPQSIIEKLEAELVTKAEQQCRSQNMVAQGISNVQMSFKGNDLVQPLNASGVAGAGYMSSIVTVAMPKAIATATVSCTQDASVLE